MTLVHPTAVVDPAAELGAGVELGPFSVVGPSVRIGDRTRVGPHSVLEGPLVIGPDGWIGAHAILGRPPQDRGYKGEPTRLEIGARAWIGDGAHATRGTVKGGGVTRIGDGAMLMAYSHVGHDCLVGEDATLVNYVALAGHVTVERQATIAGLVAVHQFVRIGRLAMVQGGSSLAQDVPPFTWAGGARARIHGLNRVGCKRAGIGSEALEEIRVAVHLLFRSRQPFSAALDELASRDAHCPEVAYLIEFCRASKRGVIRWLAE